jgi:hypothetical protein
LIWKELGIFNKNIITMKKQSNPKKVPEANDRVGYGEGVKKSDKKLPKLNEDSIEDKDK